MDFGYICEHCDKIFDEAEINQNGNDCCPYCGSEHISQRVVYKQIICDCCKSFIRDTEPIYRIEISRHDFPEHILERVCSDCYRRFKTVIDNAEFWSKNL